MGITTPSSLPTVLSHYNSNSMSQDYHQQGIFNFSNGFERSTTVTQDHHNPPQQSQHLATQDHHNPPQHSQHVGQHQLRRDKVRVHQGFEPPHHQQPSLVPHIEEDESKTGGGGLNPVYESAGMLSEMFNFTPNAAELLEQQQQSMTTTFQPSTRAVSSGGSDWYGNRQGMLTALGPLGDSNKNHHHNRDSSSNSMVHHHNHHHHQMPNINADSAAAMHLFLMNPQTTRSPSPPPSTLHMFPPPPGGSFGNFTWTQEPAVTVTNTVVEGQGLSLSLSSSLEAAKAEELRMGDSAFLYYNNQAGGEVGASSSAQSPYNKSLAGQPLQIQGGNIGIAQNHVGFGASSSTPASLGVVNFFRNSKYVNAAQELLEEFCSVGRGQFKKNKFRRQLSNLSSNPGGSGNGGGSSSSSKDVPPLSAADRIEHQRRKVKLLTMLDEVDKRYSHYCEQMHMVVNSFDLVMGLGAAVPYTALAQKAMSRHFRCLKDAITAQLKHSCEVLGEKEGAGSSGLTKGETPRLKLLEQSLRQQRAFHQMGMMEQEAWRPQRGLPERSVNILRAWLFEHFLHPYPSDADKHLLARQTGLSRNQVSNWFINARVRLWKPMVEDMYQQELKDAEGAEERERSRSNSSNSGHQATAQTPTPSTTATSSAPPTTTTPKRSDFNASESDPSIPQLNNNSNNNTNSTPVTAAASEVAPPLELQRSLVGDDTCRHGSLITTSDYGTASNAPSSDIGSSTLIRFGTTSGDVSLTLGLRHAGNMPDKTPFSVRDFGAI